MKVSKMVQEMYKKLLAESLRYDTKLWTRVETSSWDESWVEYHSPTYNGITFVVGHSAFGTAVFIRGSYVFSIRILPFSKLWRLRREMKKVVNKIIMDDFNKRLHDAVGGR